MQPQIHGIPDLLKQTKFIITGWRMFVTTSPRDSNY